MVKRKKQKAKRSKPKVIYVKDRQIGLSHDYYDAKWTALPPGKRKGKKRPYYEYRRNRSDRVGSRI